MAYVQNNNPFKRSIKEMTDKEYDAMCDNLRGGPGSDPAEEAAKAQGREKGEMNKSSQFHPDNQGPRHRSGLFYKSGKVKGIDGKACWKGYRYAGTENGKDKCVPLKKRGCSYKTK